MQTNYVAAADRPVFAAPLPSAATAAAAVVQAETIPIREVTHPLGWQQRRDASQPHSAQRELIEPK